eukprot:2397104-Lingulodinium_polyedra.AAC.1
MEKIDEIVFGGVASYTIQIVRNLAPTWSGYPTRRKRLFILGRRADINGVFVIDLLQSLINAPFLAFPGVGEA